MKKTRIWIVILLLAAFSPASALPAGAVVEEGIFEQVEGEVKVVAPDGNSRPAESGMLVKGGEIVETGAKAGARILLPDESVLELKENTRIEFNDSRQNVRGISSVLLYLGRLWGEVSKGQDGDTALEVVTPSAVAGIRGTEFSAGVGIDGSTRVGVDRGEVEVQGETGSVSVPAGKETSVELGAAPRAVSPYSPGEDEWRQWAKAREQALMAKADILPAQILKNVEGPRRRLTAEAGELKRMQRSWQSYARRERLEGPAPRIGPRIRREALRQMREMYRAAKQLQRADNRMMASYYLVKRLDQEMQAHPENYNPEFRAKIKETAQKLDAMDLKQIHRQDLALLEAYADGMEPVVSRLNLRLELRRGISEARKQRLEDLRRQRLERRGKQNQ